MGFFEKPEKKENLESGGDSSFVSLKFGICWRKFQERNQKPPQEARISLIVVLWKGNDMELVSVLMSVYNEPLEYVKNAIESITNQSYRNIQFVIIIDNPDDGDLCSFIEQYAIRDSRINIIKNKKNIGLVSSLNIGLKQCRGEYVARMDADDISDRLRIEKQIKYLKIKQLDLVGALYDTFVDDLANRGKCCKLYRSKYIGRSLEIATCLPHPTWLGKKEVFVANNGYRNITACEDYDFLIRTYQNGFKLGNVPEILLHYRLNPESISHKNAIAQKVIFKFLSYNYKRKKSVSMEKYKYFCEKSEEYKKLEKAYFYIFKYKNSKCKKISYLFPILSDYKCLRIYMKYK